jgi:hypothetical protein
MERLERERWERHEVELLAAAEVGETERIALVRARLGQGKFRENVARVEGACRITGVSNAGYLIASHIKPWRHAKNDERLSGDNGLMLAPTPTSCSIAASSRLAMVGCSSPTSPIRRVSSSSAWIPNEPSRLDHSTTSKNGFSNFTGGRSSEKPCEPSDRSSRMLLP